MKSEIIIVVNLKCGGCTHTIKTKLKSLKGVKNVSVNHENDSISVEHKGDVSRNEIITAHNNIGYPEASAENGLLLKLKNYASCAIGKISQ